MEYAAVKLMDHVSKEMESGKTSANVHFIFQNLFHIITAIDAENFCKPFSDVLLYKLKNYDDTHTAFDLMNSHLSNANQFVAFDSI